MIAIDLGSNTIRVLVISCTSKEVLYAFNKVVKTADGLSQTALINQAALTRVIEAINEAKSAYDFSKHPIRAVTTEALRRASNAEEILKTIEEKTEISFEIISGEEEAILTLLAVENRLNLLDYPSEEFVTIDIGGGSTEITFKYAHTVVSQSFPIGIVTTAQAYHNLDAIKEALPENMKAINSFIQQTYQEHGKIEAFVATAGTPTTVAAMKLGQNYASYDASKINGTLLYKEELNEYLNQLLSMSPEVREVAVGTGREDLVAAGILIYDHLFALLGFDKGIVIDDGLREGVALEYCLKQSACKA